ncbi:putative Ribulokinase [Cladochytrium replicatum]|nr:putative Ribulokinase [Cladochytrium replicatum]
MHHFVGVDVGTGSVRAAVVASDGNIVGSAQSKSILIHSPQSEYYEQSSVDIWDACIHVIKKAIESSDIDASSIRGMGFDATCSLVVLDPDGKPVPVSPNGDPKFNVIMWQDHRAIAEAEALGSTGSRVLKYTGGKISPEMSVAKLAWLKRHHKEAWTRAKHFIELPEFLTYMATGSLSRSSCSLVCKWGYMAEGQDMNSWGWDQEFLKKSGLDDVMANIERWVPGKDGVKIPGDAVGAVLPVVLERLGIPVEANVQVGTALIDAYAGALGTLGAMDPASPSSNLNISELPQRLAIIAGTSSCHIVATPQPAFVEGVWGPYPYSMLPGMYCAEGGQSATGKALDFVTSLYTPALEQVRKQAEANSRGVYDELNALVREFAVAELGDDEEYVAVWAENVFVNPDFHGNRSPLADPEMRGTISGLPIDTGVRALAQVYLATLQSLAYETRFIVDRLHSAGHKIKDVFMSGGLCQNELFVKTLADVLGMRVWIPKYPNEAVLIGAAACGAAAAKREYGKDLSVEERAEGLFEEMVRFGKCNGIVEPSKKDSLRRFHEKRYQVLLKMYEDHNLYRKMME